VALHCALVVFRWGESELVTVRAAASELGAAC
jgi:hypothetical protein